MRWGGAPLSAAMNVDRNVLPAWPPALRAETARLVGEALRLGEATAKGRAPVLTGFLRNNINVQHRGQDGTLHSRANYSAHVNYGTKYMSARPYFSEGVTRMREHFNRGMSTLHHKMPRL
jgi:hypothetical protein